MLWEKKHFLNAFKRTLYGQDNQNIPSRFINEIDKDNLDIDKNEDIKERLVKEDYIDENISYKVGDKVKHDVYGNGIIVDIKEKTISVAFKHDIGIKTFIKGHKVIKKVGWFLWLLI